MGKRAVSEMRGKITQYKLIIGEGKIGTYSDLLKSGRRGNNLTPQGWNFISLEARSLSP